MRTKTLLFLILVLQGTWLRAQDTYPSLIISEARLDSAHEAYVELTNTGDTALQLKNFEFGVVHPWNTRIDQADIKKWFHVKENSWFMLPDQTLNPGKSIVIANVYDYNPKMWRIDPDDWSQAITNPEMLRLADIQIHQPEAPIQPTIGDSVSKYYDVGQVWQGRDCWYVRFHPASGDSVVTDQVGGVFTDPNGQQAWGGKDAAGVKAATENSILLRKFSVKQGNIDFNSSRGTNAVESEWIAVPILVPGGFELNRALFWTVGNHLDAILNSETLISASISINWTDTTLIIPWGIRRDDSIMQAFRKKPGIAWHYDYSANYSDSAYVTVRTGDVLTLYACGNVGTVFPFKLIVSPPAADANIVIPKKVPNAHGNFTNTGSFCDVTDKVPGMDTIRANSFYGIPFETRVDSLIKYLDKAPYATWQIIFVDGETRPDLKNGDILQVTAEDGTHVKEYFIKVSGFKGWQNAELSSITWPDIPDSYRGEFGWAGDTIPGFLKSKFNYKVVVPYDVPGIPALQAKNADINATLLVDRAKNLTGTVADRTVTFTSTTPDGDKVLTYKVEFVKGKDPSMIQPWNGEPFISQYCFRQDYNNDFLEIVNPGTSPIDLSHYILTFSGVSNPSDAITGNSYATGTAWLNRYVKYIPGMRWEDSTSWNVSPYLAIPDTSKVNPSVMPGDVFVIADKRSVGGTAADYLIPQIDIDFAHNPWRENIRQGQAMDQNWAVISKTILWKITNDSVYSGKKPATDPNDFKLIDMLAYNNETWKVGGIVGDPATNWTRKPDVYKGNPIISTGAYPGGSFGTDETNSEWTMINELRLKSSPYNYSWPAFRIQVADGIGSHFMNEATVYKSTISSVVYKLSPGYTLESIWGVTTGTTVAQFEANLLKADPGQKLFLLSHLDNSVLADSIYVASNDTLLVLSADTMNKTKYCLSVTSAGLSKNDTITSTTYTIEINDTIGTVSGFPYGTLLKDVVAGIIEPPGCTFNVINSNNEYQPLKVMNWDTVYVDVQVTDKIYFEVIAENGVSKIVYQLKPASTTSDAFVTSDVFLVNQETSYIDLVPPNTTVYGLFKYLTPAPGATMKLVNKFGFERTLGYVVGDDILLVTAQDGMTTKRYYFQMLCCPPPTLGPLAYVVSDVYLVDQISRFIYMDHARSTLVSNFLANLIKSPFSNIKVVNAMGVENTDTLAIGDYVEVTTAGDGDQSTKVYYSIVMTRYYCSGFYLAYVVSDVYAVDQIELTIDGNFKLSNSTMVSDFIADLSAAPGASIRVINALGNENTGVLAIGDMVEVTSGDNATKVDYKLINIFDDVNMIKNSSFSIYPNPTSGIFTLSGIAAGNKILIRNVLGQQIRAIIANQNNIQLSLEGQPGGIYFIQISNDSNVLVCFKLIMN